MKKVKKIKKIPKYSNGILGVTTIDKSGLSLGKITQPKAVTDKLGQDARNVFNKNFGGTSAAGTSTVGAGDVAGVVGSIASPIAGALGIEQGKVGQTIGAIGSAVGKINPIVGAGVQVLGATAGGRASLDTSKISTTSNINDAVSHNSGWVGALFGADRDQLLRDANQYQNSMVASEMTSNLRADWANDPRNQGMISTLKEGGLVPGEHYASRNEVEVDSEGNNAVRYAWDPKGKDTYHVYTNPDGSSAEGNMIFNDEGVKRPNGMKYSDTADNIIKNIKDSKLRKISLKKLAAEQEVEKAKEGKTKNGVPAYGDGDDGRWSDKARQYMETVVEPAIVDYVHRSTYDPYGFSGSTFIPADRRIIGDKLEKELFKYSDPNIPITLGTMSGTVISPDKTFIRETVSPATIGYNQSFNRYSPTGQNLGQFGSDFKLFGEGALKPRRNLFGFDVSTTAVSPTTKEVKKATTTGTGTKSRMAVSTPAVELDPINVDERIAITGDKSKYALYNPDATSDAVITTDFKPIETPITGKVRTRPTLKAALKNLTSEDSLYKMASILTPLFDREKAETTRLQRPTWKAAPVAVDVLNQLQDAQLGYALANYNTAQGGYTAGQQLAVRSAAASTLARQRAAIHQWQTEQQNKNIAQNITSYNTHANVLAEIGNKETDINAANRAAARNINRQGRATALKNWGQILRNEKQYAMDDVRMAALEPLLQYAYENQEQIKKLVNQAKRG